MTSTDGHHPALERVSAAMDGEADDDGLRAVCTAFRDGELTQGRWHAWHMIGDVLRSEDLATDPAADAAFLQAFRARLAGEPALLAPAPLLAAGGPTRPARSHRRAWTASAAIAAGFVAVAGAVLVLQPPAPSAPARPVLAQAPAAVPAVVEVQKVAADVPPSAKVAEAEPIVPKGQVIRDARLQQYLAAHKQLGGATAIGVPAGFMRSAIVETPSR